MPAEGVVCSNTLVVPFPFIVEGKAAVGWIDESELVHRPPRALEEGCGVGGPTAPHSQLLRGNNGVCLELFIESGIFLRAKVESGIGIVCSGEGTMRVGNISGSVLPPAAFISAETGLGVVNRAGVAAVTKELGVLYEL